MNAFFQHVRRLMRPLLVGLARLCGSNIVDYRTGQVIGRGLLIAFRGRVHVLGLSTSVVPVFAPQDRVTYWQQTIVFTAHPRPDFPHEASGS